jgi:uncharacterized protein YuzE
MVAIEQYLSVLPALQKVPGQEVWLSYDAGADVLYINFRQPSVADDSELTPDDIVIRYAGDEIIGYTVLHASQRRGA